MADIKNFGIKGLSSDVQMGKSGGRLKYDPANGRFEFTQPNGSSLEDIRFGSVTSGTWVATEIGTQYGGTGKDLSNATGTLIFINGVASATAVDLANTSFVTGVLPVANGGTGSNTASGAREALQLGTIATQDADNITVTGGSINGVVIGVSNAQAITGTTITATTNFVGNITGNVTGDVTGNLTGNVTGTVSSIANHTTTSLAEGTNLYFTVDRVRGNISGGTGVSYDSNTGIIAIGQDVGTSANVSFNRVSSLAAPVSSGDATNKQYVDEVAAGLKARTAADVLYDENLVATYDNGTAGFGATLTSNSNGAFPTTDDVTLNTVGRRVLVIGQTNAAHNGLYVLDVVGDGSTPWQLRRCKECSTNVQIPGSYVFVKSGTTYAATGWVAIVADPATFTVGTDNINWTQFSGAGTYLAGDGLELTGTVFSLSASVAGNFLNYSSGVLDVDASVSNTANTVVARDAAGSFAANVVTANNFVGPLTGTAANATVLATARNFSASGDATAPAVSFNGSDNVDLALTLANTAVTAGTYGSATAIPTFTVDSKGRLTAANTVSIATTLNVSGDSGDVGGIDLLTETLTIAGGTNLTTVATANTVTVNLDNNITLSGNVTAALFTDGTATLSGGDLTAVNVTVSGTITDGIATLVGGDLNAVDVTATGVLQFGTLTDGSTSVTGIINDNSLATALANNIATAASVKNYVDTKLGNVSANIAGDSGVGSVDLDSQSLTISGGTNITTIANAQSITVNLDSNIALSTVTANTFIGALTGTAANATVLETARNFSASGDATAPAVSFNGSDNVDLALTLANTAVTAGTYGNATAIPTFTVDSKGRLTAANTVSISTNFGISGDSGTDTVQGGETLTVIGAVNQIATAVTNNQIVISIVDGAKIANLDVTGTLHSNNITSESVTVAGDAIITGNLTVQGTQTILNTTTVETQDTIFRVNSGGATGADVGFEANVGGNIKQILYTVENEWDFGNENVKATSFEGSLIGNADTATALSSAVTINISNDATGTASFTAAGDQANITLTLANTTVAAGSYGSGTAIPVITVDSKGRVTELSTANVATVLNVAGDNGTGNVNLLSDTLKVAGGTNLTSTANGNVVTVDLDANITLTSVTATTVTGNLSGNVSFVSLSDGNTTITGFVTEAGGIGNNVNDTTVPTSAAVIDYVANNAGDGLLLRNTFTANSSASSFTVGTMPNVSSRTYYADKIVIKVGTAFSGGSFNHVLVKENGGSGTVLVSANDADAAAQGTYVIELTGDEELTKNAGVVVEFKQSDGTTAAVTSAGSMVVTVHYKFV
jgi:hypothetical protein